MRLYCYDTGQITAARHAPGNIIAVWDDTLPVYRGGYAYILRETPSQWEYCPLRWFLEIMMDEFGPALHVGPEVEKHRENETSKTA